MNKTKDRLTKDYFNEIAKEYDSSADGKFVKRMYGEVVGQIMEARPQSLLDLGCGNGNVLLAVGRQCSARLYGLDLSENMIAEAGKRLAKLDGEDGDHSMGQAENAGDTSGARQGRRSMRRTDLRVGDAVALPYENQLFDVVACNASFHHYLDPGRVLKEIWRVLKPGGTFILGDPTAPSLLRPLLNASFVTRNSGDHHLYGKREMIRLLESEGFSVKKWKIISFQAFVLSATRI